MIKQRTAITSNPIVTPNLNASQLQPQPQHNSQVSQGLFPLPSAPLNIGPQTNFSGLNNPIMIPNFVYNLGPGGPVGVAPAGPQGPLPNGLGPNEINKLSSLPHNLAPPSISPSTSGLPRHWLSLQPMPPKYPFVNVYFSVRVFLVDAKKTLKTGWDKINVKIDALYDNGDPVGGEYETSVQTPVFQIHPDTPPKIGLDGFVSIKIRFLHVSMQHDNRSFQLRFSTQHDEKHYGVIVPIQTTSFTVIRHQLRITEHPPEKWFKDEGGRDKVISMSAVLVDELDAPVQNREIPLKVTLVYDGEGDVEVKNQSILKLPSDTAPKIDRYGRVNLKMRIEEVSKNHQKQAFAIKIAPDVTYMPSNNDISADVSKPITVLSKRNKKRERPSPEPVRVTPSGGPHGLPHMINHPHPTHSHNNIPNNNLLNLPPPNLPNSPRNQNDSVGSSADALLMAAKQVSPLTPSLSLSRLNALNTQTPNAGLQNSVNGIINWCQMAVKAFQALEWQHIGFEIVEDGSINMHRPILRCPGCWSYRDAVKAEHTPICSINNAINVYKSQAFPHLQDLVKIATGEGPSIPNNFMNNNNNNGNSGTLNPLPIQQLTSHTFGNSLSKIDDDDDEELDNQNNGLAPTPLTSSSSIAVTGGSRGLPSLPAFQGFTTPTHHIPPPPGVLANPPVLSSQLSMTKQPSYLSEPPSSFPTSQNLMQRQNSTDWSSSYGPPELQSYSSVMPGDLHMQLENGMNGMDPSFSNLYGNGQGFGSNAGATSSNSNNHNEVNVVSILILDNPNGHGAFDANDDLIGFYTAVGDSLVFKPVVNHKDASSLKNLLREYRQAQNRKCFSVANFITLARMKESVVLYLYGVTQQAQPTPEADFLS